MWEWGFQVDISLLNVALMGGYSIKIATSGLQAIDICLSMPVDIILLDVLMPELWTALKPAGGLNKMG